MDIRHPHRIWRHGWLLVALVALIGCEAPDRARPSSFPRASAAGEVVLIFVDPDGFPSVFEQMIIVCVGSARYMNPMPVPGRQDALQLTLPVVTVQAHVGDAVDIEVRRSGLYPGSLDGACTTPGASRYDPLDLAQTTYIRNIKQTVATLQERIQNVHDAVVNPATRANLAAAVSHVAASGAPALWTDRRHLNPVTGDQVFTELGMAVDLLTPLIPAVGAGSEGASRETWLVDELAPPPTPEPTALPDSRDKNALWQIRKITEDLARLARNTVEMLALDAEVGPAALAPAEPQIRAALNAVGYISGKTDYRADIAGFRAAWHTALVALGQR